MKKKIFDIKERTFEFSLAVIDFSNKLQKSIANDVLTKQLLRSATSIGANVIEGQAGASKKDFINYQIVALKSANETVYWLNLIRETNPRSKEKIALLVDEAIEITRILGKIIVNCKK